MALGQIAAESKPGSGSGSNSGSGGAAAGKDPRTDIEFIALMSSLSPTALGSVHAVMQMAEKWTDGKSMERSEYIKEKLGVAPETGTQLASGESGVPIAKEKAEELAASGAKQVKPVVAATEEKREIAPDDKQRNAELAEELRSTLVQKGMMPVDAMNIAAGMLAKLNEKSGAQHEQLASQIQQDPLKAVQDNVVKDSPNLNATMGTRIELARTNHEHIEIPDFRQPAQSQGKGGVLGA